MNTNFEKLVEQQFPGMNYLSVSLENLAPGDIINHEDEKIDALRRLFPARKPESWTTKKISAGIADQTITDERKLDLGANLFNIVSVQAGFDKSLTATFEFGETSAIVFDTDNGAVYENEVRGMMRALKEANDDSPKWRNVLHQFVVMECIYINSVTVTFKKNNQIIADADIPAIQQGLKIKGEYLWGSDGKLTIRNNTTPFGVRGFLVKKTM